MPKTSLFDGKVIHYPPERGEMMWEDVWVGPGGRLVVARLDPSAPAAHLGVDALETLYAADGEVVQYPLAEGAEYHLLPRLMGEYWEQYRSA